MDKSAQFEKIQIFVYYPSAVNVGTNTSAKTDTDSVKKVLLTSANLNAVTVPTQTTTPNNTLGSKLGNMFDKIYNYVRPIQKTASTQKMSKVVVQGGKKNVTMKVNPIIQQNNTDVENEKTKTSSLTTSSSKSDSDLPYLCTSHVLTLESFFTMDGSGTHRINNEIIDTQKLFFDRAKLSAFVLKKNFAVISDPSDKQRVLECNFKIMLYCLFPTHFISTNLVHESVDRSFNITSRVNNIRSTTSTFPQHFSTVDGKTVLNVIWLNDIYNHPLFNTIFPVLPMYNRYMQSARQRIFAMKKSELENFASQKYEGMKDYSKHAYDVSKQWVGDLQPDQYSSKFSELNTLIAKLMSCENETDEGVTKRNKFLEAINTLIKIKQLMPQYENIKSNTNVILQSGAPQGTKEDDSRPFSGFQNTIILNTFLAKYYDRLRSIFVYEKILDTYFEIDKSSTEEDPVFNLSKLPVRTNSVKSTKNNFQLEDEMITVFEKQKDAFKELTDFFVQLQKLNTNLLQFSNQKLESWLEQIFKSNKLEQNDGGAQKVLNFLIQLSTNNFLNVFKHKDIMYTGIEESKMLVSKLDAAKFSAHVALSVSDETQQVQEQCGILNSFLRKLVPTMFSVVNRDKKITTHHLFHLGKVAKPQSSLTGATAQRPPIKPTLKNQKGGRPKNAFNRWLKTFRVKKRRQYKNHRKTKHLIF